MTLYEAAGWISTIVVLIPVTLLLYFKLALYRSFPALLFYFGILFTCNIFLLDIFGGSIATRSVQDVLYNTLIAPLSLAFLTYFARNISLRRKMMAITAGLVLFEVVVLSAKGFTDDAYRILTAPGLLLTLVFSVYFFTHQVKLSIIYQKAAGKAILVSAMLFSTIGLLYVYIVRYFINPQYRQDADLIQFLLGLFIAVAVAVGIILERKRVQQLEELRVAREELKQIYGAEAKKATGPFGTVAFNFDSESYR